MFSAAFAGHALAGLLDQRRAVEPRRVQRLQDVVAGGGEEARLAEIGLLGKHLRLRQFLVDLRQFGGAAAARAAPAIHWRCFSARSAATRAVMSA